MKRVCVWVAAAAVVVCTGAGAARAQAESFESLRSQATEVVGLWGLGALVWSKGEPCAKLTNDVDKRQCEGVVAGRRAQLDGGTFLVTGDGSAVEVGAYNDKTLSAGVSVAPCLACAAPVDVDGDRLYIVGSSKFAITGGKVSVSAVKSTTMTWASADKYAKYLEEVVPRLRTEFVVKLAGAKPWNKSGARGMTVEVLGWRVLDPCKGKVLLSEPQSADVSPDKRACGDSAEPEKKPVEETKPAEPAKPAPPKLPYKLSPFQINPHMAPVRKAAQKCFEAYGVAGKASYSITFNNEGAIVKVDESGDFKDTPTGACIRKALDGVSFPKMRAKSMTFDFPVILR